VLGRLLVAFQVVGVSYLSQLFKRTIKTEWRDHLTNRSYESPELLVKMFREVDRLAYWLRYDVSARLQALLLHNRVFRKSLYVWQNRALN